MKLALKLLAAPLLTAVVMFGTGQLNAVVLGRADTANRLAFQAQRSDFQALDSAKDRLAAVHTGVYRTVALIASLDEAKIKSYRDEVLAQLAAVKVQLAAIAAVHPDDTALQDAAMQLARLVDTYGKQADAAIDLSSVDPNTGIAAMRNADDSFAAVAKTMAGMLAAANTRSNEAMQASDRQTLAIGWWLAGLGLLCAGVAVTLSWWMQRRLTAELQRAADIAGEVSAGNLAVDTGSTRVDDVGDLVRALGRMTSQLGASMHTVLASSDWIRTASAEIASGNQDLSQRTEQTAFTLQQTAASMEQLHGTLQRSADSALQANRLAATAAEVAARGGSVVAQVVSTMEDINSSSRRISDIIGVIDGIAFQTNILALNAAVEAARAGEQGRGFAVVASEVRSLAQRSAQAAKEIKSLIGASVEKVEGGTRLVANAGQTMAEIVASVHEVSEIIATITTASAAQSTGIGQINASVLQIDQMTQQNSALVEQSASAAESLKDQAVALAGVVGTFRLAPRDQAAAAAA